MRTYKKTVFWKQYEFRVVLILISVITASTILLYQLIFFQVKKVMLDDLKDDAKTIHEYVEEIIDAKSFEQLNTIEDESKECYGRLHEQLNQVRRIANIRYLYTAKRNDKGEYIYVIDGLDKDAEDFRHVGMLIEEEIIPDLEKSLNNQIILDDDVMDTEWGGVYVTYFPVHDGYGEVIGAIGMEFDVENLNDSFYRTQMLSVIFSIIVAAVCLFLSIILLRRVSEPIYKRMAYTDLMTNMNNRTAFELEMKEMDSNLKNEDRISIVIYDLNNLKLVNDKLGHSMGDVFIKKVSGLLLDVYGESSLCFRIGGDEFAVLMVGKTKREALAMVRKTKEESKERLVMGTETFGDLHLGTAYGFAMFDTRKDTGIYDTFNRADDNMYKMKRLMKKC